MPDLIYALLMDRVDLQPIAYPLPESALLPTWRSRRSQGLGAVAVAALVIGLALRWPVLLLDADDILLRHALPATLAFIMAFTPPSSTRVGRIAQDLTVLGLCVAVFAGDWLPLLLACYPVLLMIAVVIGEFGLLRRYWGRGL
ncbi:MAG: hypothetical protein KF889_15820 [Alphaproteobacteria bacterium]|nr:hypothetical protein [Alphaproteobacteria bacterium]MCW5740162.1 hypothetical protein [Alphaproteobacteria bacterium]